MCLSVMYFSSTAFSLTCMLVNSSKSNAYSGYHTHIFLLFSITICIRNISLPTFVYNTNVKSVNSAQ